eukprot:12006191-Alexandrium_andersonii.AAC.1
MCGTECGAALPPLAAFWSRFLRAPTPLSPGRLPPPRTPQKAAGAALPHIWCRTFVVGRLGCKESGGP